MAGAGAAGGQGSGVGKLESQIYCIKYTLFCFNVILWLFGVSIFALCLWICIEPGFNEWMRMLELQKYFIGIYLILICSLIIMVVAFLGCGAALMENTFLLFVYIATQAAVFVFGLVGSCVVLDFSTYDSSIQPLIREVILRMMNNPQHEGSREIMRMVQEGIGCCGADGPMDYINLNKPLPSECRDSVTGNAYFHGCVDEMTWYLEGKTGWLAGIVLASCMIAIVNAVMSLVLIQAVKKEDEEATIYKN
ncbi:tetraspanin-2A [Hyposmocoma kahamanoa]|uniref:tetraspanin-2A n=1 Tax=Hyposmocoma kahamanoa TaxID=1477025 RepID=UPI000E6D65DC|nr:tetraspanin-2A [Hyposmocoma kahamanoa]